MVDSLRHVHIQGVFNAQSESGFLQIDHNVLYSPTQDCALLLYVDVSVLKYIMSFFLLFKVLKLKDPSKYFISFTNVFIK